MINNRNEMRKKIKQKIKTNEKKFFFFFLTNIFNFENCLDA